MSRTPDVEMPENPRLKIAVAYDIPRGDPLSNWNPLDFRIGKGDGCLLPRGTGVNVKLLTENVLGVQVMSDAFKLHVSGFDEHRDLFVRVDELSNGETES